MIEIEEIPITDATFTDVPLCRSCPVRFVDELPDSIVDIRLAIRHGQPELGHLIRITFYRPDRQTFSTGYFKIDKRKLKRMVKRFGWKLPQSKSVSRAYPEKSE